MRLGPLEIPDPETFTPGFGQVRISGWLGEPDEVSADQVVFLGRQVAALEGQVVHVTTDFGFIPDAWYRVVSADVEQIGGVQIGARVVVYDATLAPVSGHEDPMIESHVSGALRQNDHSITSDDARPFHCVPSAATMHDWWAGAGGTSTTTETRDTEFGPVNWAHRAAVTTNDPYYSGVARYKIPAADAHHGACRITCETDGAWLPVTSRDALIGSWRIDNGMVRAFVPTGGDELSFQWYDGSDWSPVFSFQQWIGVSFDPTTRLCEWHGARVSQVTNETATVVVDGREGSGLDFGVVHLEMTVRRGSPWVDCFLTRMTREAGGAGSPGGYPGVYATTPVAVTDATHSMRLTTASSGWQWIVATPDDNTVDTTNGGISTNAGLNTYTLAFGVGAIHSSWSGVRTSSNAHREYFAAQAERTHIGVRL